MNTLNMTGVFSIRKEITVDYRGFISALLSDGLHYFDGYGFTVDTSFYNNYEEAKSKLTQHGLDAYLEDVWTQILLDGGEIVFRDIEGDGEYTTSLDLGKIEAALHKFLNEEPSDAFMLAFDRVHNEEYDTDDCDVLLQYILFGEYMFS